MAQPRDLLYQLKTDTYAPVLERLLHAHASFFEIFKISSQYTFTIVSSHVGLAMMFTRVIDRNDTKQLR